MIISRRAKSLLQAARRAAGSRMAEAYECRAAVALAKVTRRTIESEMRSSRQHMIYHFCESKQQSPNVIPIERMKQQIEKDIQQQYASFPLIRSSLVHHITLQNYNKSNPAELISVLSLLSAYPTFPLDSATMLAIYKLTCHNLHLKSVQTMNQLLNFVLVADSQASQSPIFHEFLRFYLILPLQEFKFKFQLDFANMSITQAIRQFFGKLIHRGFLSRTPPYERNLNVTDPRKTLLLLRRNKSVESTLMVKKLNYTIFMEIKEFYEKEMKENLYHPKKVTLLNIFTDHFMEILSEEIEMTHHETVHLRELYMKVYLTLPDGEEPVDQGLEVFKYRKAITLYRLAVRHIQSMDHLKIEQIDEKIDVVIEFVQKVEENIRKLLKYQEKELSALKLDFEEILIVILWAKEKKINPKQCQGLFTIIQSSVNCFTLWHHFETLTEVLYYLSSVCSIENIVGKYDNYSLLTLAQLSTFAEASQSQKSSHYCVVDNVLRRVLSTDFEIIGGTEVVEFLHIYRSAVSVAEGTTAERVEALRRFVMRYIADRHAAFSLRHFEEIVKSLLILPHENCDRFDDAAGNYPLSVFEQIKPHISKVGLFFSAETKDSLANDSRTRTT